MGLQKATNAFTKGMIMDINDLDVSNDVLISALNATVGTFNGNEGTLQNDMGNARISQEDLKDDSGNQVYVGLKENYTPIGSVEFGGIYYIVSINADEDCEIGCFPSPNYENKEGALEYKYRPLNVLTNSDGTDLPFEKIKCFGWNTEHPLNIIAESSFDGSVNLIINDGENPPRLINTGFQVRANETYRIIERIGGENTNRYLQPAEDDNTTFDLQTSLYRDYSKLSYFEFGGLDVGGLLKIGTYSFYALSCDKDGNESDIIAESGIIPVFLGTDGDPFSVNGGLENLTSDKCIKFTLKNVDDAYPYVKFIYTRSTAQDDLLAETIATKINHIYNVNRNSKEECNEVNVTITGYEDTSDISINDLNILYFNADNAKAQAILSNILFLGNVVENNHTDTEYEKLRNWSIEIYPKIIRNKIDDDNDFTFDLISDYSHKGNNNYYSSLFIYNYTGYHPEEFYRFGIVYIRKDNSLTTVFDVLGVDGLNTDTNIANLLIDLTNTDAYPFIDINNETTTSEYQNYNAKGVSRISPKAIENLTDIIGILFIIPEEVKNNLKTNYKGYFFVRQKRIPTILGQGYATNICEESFLPSINIPSSDSDSSKLYLYESFVRGGMKSLPTNITDNFYPKLTAVKVESSFLLTNNYRSRIFTLSNYTYLYLDKMLGTGPVSTFLSDVVNLDVDYFKDSSYTLYEDVPTIVKLKNDKNTKKNVNYLVVHYATPEKWDDKGESDGSSGRTVLWTNYDENQIIPIVHVFREYKFSEHTYTDSEGKENTDNLSNYYRVVLDCNANEELTEKREKEDCCNFTLYENKVNTTTITEDDGSTYDSSETTSSWKDAGITGNLFEANLSNDNSINLLSAPNYAATRKNKWTVILHTTSYDQTVCTEYDEETNEPKTTDTITEHDKILDPLTLYLACGPTGSTWFKKVLSIVGGVFTLFSGDFIVALTGLAMVTAAGVTALKDAEDSSIYTEILGMLLSPRRTHNAGLGINMYISKDINLTSGRVLFEVDGAYYEPYAAFSGYNSNPETAVENLINQLYNYVATYEKSDESSTSELAEDPTTPTFDGKYGQTNETDEDALRIKLHTMELGAYGVYCPEYELNQPYYNNIFTGLDVKVKPLTKKTLLTVQNNFKDRHYIYSETELNNESTINKAKAISVTENTSLLMVKKYTDNDYAPDISDGSSYWPRTNNYFSSKASDATEIGFKYVGGKSLAHINLTKFSDTSLTNGKVNINIPYNIVRGTYGSYVGISSPKDISDSIVNIYIPGYNITDNDENNTALTGYYQIRFDDRSPYYAISDRCNLNSDNSNVCFRGDCYINYYTHRINRNFNDDTAPYNNTIISAGCFSNGFSKNFDAGYRTFDLSKDPESAEKINIGDINAVSLGSWVTFPVRSTMNTALRSDDGSYTSEVLACGHNRTFYPLYSLDAGGSNKIPESTAFNAGYNRSTSDKLYVNTNNQVFEKTYYKNRIVYSNVLQNNSSFYANGHRTFLATHYKDVPELYGEIIKLIPYNYSGLPSLICVCEHGILQLVVNERQLLANSSGGPVFINTNNVLSEPTIVSTDYGSKYVESVISTPYGIFGVDESSKKIWWLNSSNFNLISDYKILKFLNDNLHLGSINIGTCNLKTFYNKYKNDVMFTLYDINKDKPNSPDNLWNICYNINQGASGDNGWQTFYSWIPLDALNIGNNFISTNLKLNCCDTECNELSTILYYWKHGQSLRVPSVDKIKPTYWYGHQHPFEFEFIVKEGVDTHKIFDDLQIISNNVAPESFHYEIVGDCYDFEPLKEAAYVALEKLKQLFSTDLSYDKSVNDRELLEYNKSNYGRLIAFPMYYVRLDEINQIYDNYKLMTAVGYNYNYLTGTELIYNELKDEYHLWNHVKGVDTSKEGLLRGNMRYIEDKWRVQINPIFYVIRNTSASLWINGVPLFINNIKNTNSELIIPDDIKNDVYVDRSLNNKRLSVKVKDKYVRIRIRYTGDKLALINYINTLYTISYS